MIDATIFTLHRFFCPFHLEIVRENIHLQLLRRYINYADIRGTNHNTHARTRRDKSAYVMRKRKAGINISRRCSLRGAQTGRSSERITNAGRSSRRENLFKRSHSITTLRPKLARRCPLNSPHPRRRPTRHSTH